MLIGLLNAIIPSFSASFSEVAQLETELLTTCLAVRIHGYRIQLLRLLQSPQMPCTIPARLLESASIRHTEMGVMRNPEPKLEDLLLLIQNNANLGSCRFSDLL